MTRMEYPYYEGRGRDSEYTLVVADLIDSLLQQKQRVGQNIGTSKTSPVNLGFNDNKDLVEGYTIRQIEDALVGLRNWNSWRDNIIRRHMNASEGHVDSLFKHWGTYR